MMWWGTAKQIQKECNRAIERAKQAPRFDYDKEVSKLNLMFGHKIEIVLKPETVNDITCDWRTAIMVYKNRNWVQKSWLEFNIYPNSDNQNWIPKYIEIFEQKEIPMIEEEAIARINKSKFNKGWDDINSKALVYALEALGVIKLEEPKEDGNLINVIHAGILDYQYKPALFIKHLNDCGYKIVRKNNAT